MLIQSVGVDLGGWGGRRGWGLLHFLEKKSTIYRCTEHESTAVVRKRRRPPPPPPFHKSRVPLTETTCSYSNECFKFDPAKEPTPYSQPFYISGACTEADPDKDPQCSQGALWCAPVMWASFAAAFHIYTEPSKKKHVHAHTHTNAHANNIRQRWESHCSCAALPHFLPALPSCTRWLRLS